jgi:hypothetical protein
VLKLLRWCHVQDEALLPDIWKQLANAPKGQHRRVIQGAMDDTCEQLGFRNLNFQITTTVSKKVVGLEWVMHVADDLSTGLHPFTVGYVTAEQAKAQRQRNRESDMLYANEAAPSLANTKALLSDSKVHIPFTILQGRLTHQQAYVLYYTLLGGTQHPLVQQYKQHYEEYMSREAELESVHPRDPRHYYLVPALLVWWVQLEVSYLIRRQSTSNTPVGPPSLQVLFDDIARGKDWAPLLPKRYLAKDAATPTQVNTDTGSAISGLTGSSGSIGSNPQGGTPAATSDVPKVEYNLEYQDRFQKYKEMGLPTRQVKAFCLKQKVKLPWNHALKKSMCISFHIKGVCNNRCGSSGDHKPHTK